MYKKNNGLIQQHIFLKYITSLYEKLSITRQCSANKWEVSLMIRFMKGLAATRTLKLAGIEVQPLPLRHFITKSVKSSSLQHSDSVLCKS